MTEYYLVVFFLAFAITDSISDDSFISGLIAVRVVVPDSSSNSSQKSVSSASSITILISEWNSANDLALHAARL